jgi:hypothetical protein
MENSYEKIILKTSKSEYFTEANNRKAMGKKMLTSIAKEKRIKK